MLDTFEFLSPPAHLQKFVKYLWVIEGTASVQAPYHHRALVDGCTQLLFEYRGGFQRLQQNGQQSPRLKSALVAQTTTSLIYRITEDFSLFGICLYPFSIPYLMGIDGRDFIDGCFAPGEVFGGSMPDLEQAMLQADRHDGRLALTEELFRPYLNRMPDSEPTIFAILRDMFQAQKPDALNDLVHPETISSRHLQRQCKRYTGFTPKQLARILRMQLTLSEGSSQSLSGIAADGSYYDQSHFTNEFRVLAGTTPNDYFTGSQLDARWRWKGEEVAFFQSNVKPEHYPTGSANQENTDGDD